MGGGSWYIGKRLEEWVFKASTNGIKQELNGITFPVGKTRYLSAESPPKMWKLWNICKPLEAVGWRQSVWSIDQAAAKLSSLRDNSDDLSSTRLLCYIHGRSTRTFRYECDRNVYCTPRQIMEVPLSGCQVVNAFLWRFYEAPDEWSRIRDKPIPLLPAYIKKVIPLPCCDVVLVFLKKLSNAWGRKCVFI